jgi:hypothetical protein
MRVLLGNRPGGLPAIRESVGAKNLENFWVENSVKLGSVAKANQRGELVAAKPETLAYRNWKLNRLTEEPKCPAVVNQYLAKMVFRVNQRSQTTLSC